MKNIISTRENSVKMKSELQRTNNIHCNVCNIFWFKIIYSTIQKSLSHQSWSHVEIGSSSNSGIKALGKKEYKLYSYEDKAVSSHLKRGRRRGMQIIWWLFWFLFFARSNSISSSNLKEKIWAVLERIPWICISGEPYIIFSTILTQKHIPYNGALISSRVRNQSHKLQN